MEEAFKLPTWIEAAYAQAQELADESNARWAESIGEFGLFGGFQVEPVTQEIDGKDELRFASVLYGGRSFVGTPDEVRAAQRAYVLNRSIRGRRAA